MQHTQDSSSVGSELAWSSTILVRRATAGAQAHVEAVRAALRDSRISLKDWSNMVGLSVRTVRRWRDGRPIQDSYEAHLWSAAVTTSVPGWRNPTDAMEIAPPQSAGDVPRDGDDARTRTLERRARAWEAIQAHANTLYKMEALRVDEWHALLNATGPGIGTQRHALQAVDVALALYLMRSTVDQAGDISSTLGLSVADATASLDRLRTVGLIDARADEGIPITTPVLLAYLAFGMRFDFPGVLGERCRGLSTAFCGTEWRDDVAPVDVIVWPSSEWRDEGRALLPLLPKAPDLAAHQPHLYETLAAADAVRAGRPTDRLVALAQLARWARERKQPVLPSRAAVQAAESADDHVEEWRANLGRLRALSTRVEALLGRHPYDALLSTPQRVLGGTSGVACSPINAVLAGAVEPVCAVLEWLTIPANAGAPSVSDGAFDAGRSRQGQIGAILARAASALGSVERAERWLTKPNRALGEAIPLRLLESADGVEAVLRVLTKIEHGVFS